MAKLVSASLLSADKTKMITELKKCEISNVDLIHYDVMDNVFVPNESFNDDTFSRIRKFTKLNFEVHLMVSNPFDYIKKYKFSHNDVIIVHAESFANQDDLRKCLLEIKKTHKVGLSIKPHTDCALVDPFLDILDYVLIMSVEPGFGGKKFIDFTLDKIEYFANKKQNYHYVVEVDGGINQETAAKCFKRGLDIAVSGSYLFKGDMKANVEALKNE